MTSPSGSVFSSRMTRLAVVSAASLPLMPVWERIFLRVVEWPLPSRYRMRPIMASRRCLCGECGREAGSVIIASKICRVVRESVAIWRSPGSFAKVIKAWWMATSSARRTVLFSSNPVASISISVEVAG